MLFKTVDVLLLRDPRAVFNLGGILNVRIVLNVRLVLNVRSVFQTVGLNALYLDALNAAKFT